MNEQSLRAISLLGLFLMVGVLILRTEAGYTFFAWVKSGFDVVMAATQQGAQFLFGNLTKAFLLENVLVPGPEGLVRENIFPISAVLAFRILPMIIFIATYAPCGFANPGSLGI
jgi:nucleoside permease NupC